MKRCIAVIILIVGMLNATAMSGIDSNFLEEPIVLKTSAGNIMGTVTMPMDSLNVPVALIIAGSGPTDRNGNSPQTHNNSLKMLANELANNGIASVRFDKRGIGESAAAMKDEKDILFDTYVSDARNWIELLKNDRRFKGVYIIGHSEGSLIGLASASTGVNGLVSISGAGKSADKILKVQLSAQSQAVKDACYSIIDSLTQGKLVQSVDPSLYSLFRPSIQPYLISWFHYDPATKIKTLHIPLLIIQGNNDLQVSVDDAKALSAANPNAKLIVIDSMNHIMKIVASDRAANIAAYNNPTLPISPVLVQSIVHFIKQSQ